MIIEEGIYQHLSNLEPIVELVEDKVYWSQAPQDVTSPYIVNHMISDKEYYDLGGDIGLSSAVVQMECWADSYFKSSQLSEVLRMHISGFAGYFGGVKIQMCKRTSIRDDTSEDAEAQGKARYCKICDYEIVYEKERAYL